jgi:hypothetical protein
MSRSYSFATSKTPRETDRKAGRKIVMVSVNEYVVVDDVRLAMGATSYRRAGGVQSIGSGTMAYVLMVDVSELAPTDCEARVKADYIGRAICIGDANDMISGSVHSSPRSLRRGQSRRPGPPPRSALPLLAVRGPVHREVAPQAGRHRRLGAMRSRVSHVVVEAQKEDMLTLAILCMAAAAEHCDSYPASNLFFCREDSVIIRVANTSAPPALDWAM